MPTLSRKQARELGIIAKAAPRRVPGSMNKTEARYAEHLGSLQADAVIHNYRFEPIKLRLGRDWKTTLTVDFMVVHLDGRITLVDVKGRKGDKFYATEDSLAKLKCAAEQYPEFRFVIVWPSESGGWESMEL